MKNSLETKKTDETEENWLKLEVIINKDELARKTKSGAENTKDEAG